MSDLANSQSFSHRIRDRIRELISLACDDVARPGLLIGLSGGPDSVALLLAAHAWSQSTGHPLAAAHLNHQLRGQHADDDSLFCIELCSHLNIPLHQASKDPRPVARLRGQGLEEAGRHLRRRFFLSLLANNPDLHCVATGHHLDDQVETVIMRLFRGTGPDGLQGIKPVQGPFIRPLLAEPRTALVDFLQQQGQPWRTDSTNLEGDNLRARLRRELLPVARDIFGQGSAHVPARMAELLGPDLALLDRLAQQARMDLSHTDGLDIAGLLALDDALARRVLRCWLAEQSHELELVHVQSVLQWLAEGRSGTGLDLPGGLRLVRSFDTVQIDKTKSGAPPLRSAADYRILIERNTTPDMDPTDDDDGRTQSGPPPWRLTCPATALQGNLKIRNWRDGDRMQPFGLNGTKKLSDMLRERRIAASERENILVVTDEAGILWVIGLARSERTRMLPSTAPTVTISVAERSSGLR